MKRKIQQLNREYVYTLTHNGECVARCHTLSDAFVEASLFRSGQFEIRQLECDNGYTLIPSQEKNSIKFEIASNTITKYL